MRVPTSLSERLARNEGSDLQSVHSGQEALHVGRDAPDLLTPLSFADSSLSFPDKERATNVSSLSISSLGLSERKSVQRQQRKNSISLSRSTSFNSLRGQQPGTTQSLSRQCSMEGSQPDSDRVSLKVFVPAPSNDGKKSEPLSKDTLNYLHEVACNELNNGSRVVDAEKRPPSPRPLDEKTRVQMHSEVLESWEESTRLRTGTCLAGPKYRRSDSQLRADSYKAEP